MYGPPGPCKDQVRSDGFQSVSGLSRVSCGSSQAMMRSARVVPEKMTRLCVRPYWRAPFVDCAWPGHHQPGNPGHFGGERHRGLVGVHPLLADSNFVTPTENKQAQVRCKCIIAASACRSKVMNALSGQSGVMAWVQEIGLLSGKPVDVSLACWRKRDVEKAGQGRLLLEHRK
jgi:hypothetical protein